MLSDRQARAGISVVLFAAGALRLVLVWLGGGFFFPDESRYLQSTHAASLLNSGEWAEGLAGVFSSGVHPGFVLLGVIPALVESSVGSDPRIPGMFFAVFSAANLLLIILIAARLGYSARQQLVVAALSAITVELLYFSRHLVPYDASMFFGLLAIFMAISPKRDFLRPLGAGAAAGFCFLTYLAYWPLAGWALVVATLWPLSIGWRIIGRGVAAALGFGSVLVWSWFVNLGGDGQMLTNVFAFSGMIYHPGYAGGYLLAWSYILTAERLLGVIFVIGLVIAIIRLFRSWRDIFRPVPLWLPTFSILFLYAAMVWGSDIAQRTVVTGRVARLLAPWMCLGSGYVLSQLVAGRENARRYWAGLSIVGLMNFAPALLTMLRQQFPAQFRADAELARKTVPAVAGTYLLTLNVESWVFAPDILPRPPLETIIAAEHPLEFTPYMFELYPTAEREFRNLIDQRMRVVRMAVPKQQKIAVEAVGTITVKLKFPTDRSGLFEPLLSIGAAEFGTLLFVQYQSPETVVPGIELAGIRLIGGEAVRVEPGEMHEFKIKIESLHQAGSSASVEQLYQYSIEVDMDGNTVLQGYLPGISLHSDHIVVGGNPHGLSSATPIFTGEVIEVASTALPKESFDVSSAQAFGPIRLQVELPEHAGAIPEPLMTQGIPGQAYLVYAKVMNENAVQWGVEIWGVGAYESPPMDIPEDRQFSLTVQLPSMYPPVDDNAWGNQGRDRRREILSRVRLMVDDEVVVDHCLADPGVVPPKMELGVNSLGGSWVSSKFTGRILFMRRMPF